MMISIFFNFASECRGSSELVLAYSLCRVMQQADSCIEPLPACMVYNIHVTQLTVAVICWCPVNSHKEDMFSHAGISDHTLKQSFMTRNATITIQSYLTSVINHDNGVAVVFGT